MDDLQYALFAHFTILIDSIKASQLMISCLHKGSPVLPGFSVLNGCGKPVKDDLPCFPCCKSLFLCGVAAGSCTFSYTMQPGMHKMRCTSHLIEDMIVAL